MYDRLSLARATRGRATLVVPAWHQLPDLIAENQRSLEQSSLRLGDRTLADVRQLALECATTLARSAGESSSLQRPIIVTGHQPELFHPGVWAKNVAISKLAKQLKGSSFNFNIDSDVAKNTTLKLPVADGDHVDQSFSFSSARPPLPYEEWQCEDEAEFASLPERVQPVLESWPWKPVLPEFWQAAMAAGATTKNLPERWVLARRQWEMQHGIQNHELTMCRWCQTPFFGWLLSLFIADHARFAGIYNEELHAYRKEHRIRSAHHPVADLLVTGDLIELPFWAWPAGSLQRGRLCARQQQDQVQLVALVQGKEIALPFTQDSALSTQHYDAGWKIRPKALITSMMFRLFLADLFVHGIGGAVYDELTDRIFARFWNTRLPRFAIVTATLRLPWNRVPVTDQEPRKLRQSLRTLHWNPDQFLTEPLDDQARRLQSQKQQLIKTSASLVSLNARHQQYEAIRSQLYPYVMQSEQRITQSLTQTLQKLKRDEHHFSREHPWVLYPQEILQGLIGSNFDSALSAEDFKITVS